MKVEILNETKAPIPGFTLAEATAVTGDVPAATISWTKPADLRVLAGKTIILRFYLKGGDLYSYWLE